MVTTELQNQHVAVHEPWTTGFGVGYRIKEWVNVCVEPKWHEFEFYYEGEPQNETSKITSYHTFSLGVGVYFAWQLFKDKDSAMKGLLIAPSVRFWPTVSNSQSGSFTYQNKITGQAGKIEKLAPRHRIHACCRQRQHRLFIRPQEKKIWPRSRRSFSKRSSSRRRASFSKRRSDSQSPNRPSVISQFWARESESSSCNRRHSTSNGRQTQTAGK